MLATGVAPISLYMVCVIQSNRFGSSTTRLLIAIIPICPIEPPCNVERVKFLGQGEQSEPAVSFSCVMDPISYIFVKISMNEELNGSICCQVHFFSPFQ